MSTVNLYDVLNVSQDSTTKEIKDAYRVLVKEFHPDKPGGDAEMFELITQAYNVLSVPQLRQEYDHLNDLSKQIESSHFDLKVKAKKYYDALDTDITKGRTSKEDQHKSFKKAYEEMDRKHGYKRDTEHEIQLNTSDTSKRLRDLQMAREQDDIENIHEQIFDGHTFSISKFNAAFDAMHRGHDELIPHTGTPSAYNVNDGFSNFSSIDGYENLYADEVDDVGTSVYGSVNLNNTKKKKLSKEELRKIKEAEYTKGHNYKDKNYNKTLEEKIREREMETRKFEDRSMKEFDEDPSCGGYGIFDQVGISKMNSLTFDDDEDVKSRYKRLLEMRKQDLK